MRPALMAAEGGHRKVAACAVKVATGQKKRVNRLVAVLSPRKHLREGAGTASKKIHPCAAYERSSYSRGFGTWGQAFMPGCRSTALLKGQGSIKNKIGELGWSYM